MTPRLRGFIVGGFFAGGWAASVALDYTETRAPLLEHPVTLLTRLAKPVTSCRPGKGFRYLQLVFSDPPFEGVVSRMDYVWNTGGVPRALLELKPGDQITLLTTRVSGPGGLVSAEVWAISSEVQELLSLDETLAGGRRFLWRHAIRTSPLLLIGILIMVVGAPTVQERFKLGR